MFSLKFLLTNITCDACTKVSQLKLKRIPGVKNVYFERQGNRANGLVESQTEVTLAELQAALDGTPYRVEALD